MCAFDFSPDSRSCLMCGSDKLFQFKARASDATDGSHVSIVQCKVCSFAWQYPVAQTVAEGIEYFEASYADGGKTRCDYFDPNHKRDIARLELAFVAELPVEHQTLLDVGAGAGIFAEVAAENGWNVTAVDPALDVGATKNHSTLRTIRGTISTLSKEEVFDVVTLWDVMPYLSEPLRLLSSASDRVKANGWLVIESGNYKSADRASGGISHWMYQLGQRWYFAPESVRRLLACEGFGELLFSEKVLRPGWNGGVGYAGPSWLSLAKSVIREPMSLPTHLAKYVELTKAKTWEMSGIGIFAVAARKPNGANCGRTT